MWDERSRRIQILAVIVIGIILTLIFRLMWMQLFQGAQYKKIADQNRTRQITAQAPRGTIYDRNGAVVVANRPSFAVSIIPSEYSNPQQSTPLLAALTGVTADQINQLLQATAEFPYTPVRIKRDIDAATIAKIEERQDYLPGVLIEAIPVRQYVYKELAAHVLGYVGNISQEEYAARKDQGYHPNDLIGKDGLEQQWETVLRGIEGGRQLEVNAVGEDVRPLGNQPAVPGHALVLTLDANLQKAAEEALHTQVAASRTLGQQAKGGAVVVLDVKTGGLLVMASAPGFDPNQFASGIGSREWNQLLSNPNNPLTNRAIQSAYPPASVFKIVTSAAALEMQVTTPQEVFDDKGVYVLNGWSFYGWETKGLGKLTVADALAWSSDPVFYELGNRIGVDNLAAYALTFGYGQATGIKLAGEEKGLVPTAEWKQATYDEPWYPGETLIAAIGQGYYLATPLQQAVTAMTVANGGIAYRPVLVDKVLTEDGNLVQKVEPEVIRTVYLRPEVWDIIRQGMTAVTTRGTGAAVFQGFPRTVAAKSGSAETGRGTTHSWFVCYAPAENPEIAMAVFVEEGGEGSMAAAPITRRVLEAYFGLPGKPSLPTTRTD
ncbi:penicillin-binding protein 2 [Sporomusa acidovorans]|uniref:Peptidoglycan D,D-transpeptidase MrdA n=1 Tax=Sporomusa acidovorans (strain ATCC 49682 / DSM 3132 / Mol) TaxID=1123286 RepID=A0ABZ3JAS2_SPOA4|nr:penicillin-binding protein 2 [Sporomusa acidovorans]OZC22919.1 stage V sporulation protein D [Sporomusa acidovorans DSM 3132]SDE95271.1 peptidoglycan glycosyltransferase [Sporomusa acidovorans]